MCSRLPTLRGRGLVPVGFLVDCGEAFESGKNRALDSLWEAPAPLLMSPTDPWEGA